MTGPTGPTGSTGPTGPTYRRAFRSAGHHLAYEAPHPGARADPRPPRGFIHPFSDAAHLAADLPCGRLLPTWTLLELRLRPRRLLRAIDRFLGDLDDLQPGLGESRPARAR